ncbi:hypothetical protein PUN28_003971 [Cardiocondyla obscurior]|uniref:Uncharacterized protein n=1 Tax=Cardiocondyla obscurior TaxID=286306 RepID=A0AAW2GNB8_9HYME
MNRPFDSNSYRGFLWRTEVRESARASVFFFSLSFSFSLKQGGGSTYPPTTRVSHPRAQQGSCRVQRRRRRLPATRCRSARRVFRSAVTFGDAAATATSARTKVQAQPTAADRATAASAAAAVSAAATSGHANTVLKSIGIS